MRGSEALIRRSRNSYMCSPRRVTFAPIACSLRSLKFAMLFLARVSAGFWPVIRASSVLASSKRLLHVRLRADGSVDHNLLQLWDLVIVLVAVLLRAAPA